MFSIARNFSLLSVVVKILGLFPLTSYETCHKVSRKALLLTLCNISLFVFCYTVYFYHVFSKEKKVSTFFKSTLYFKIDQVENILNFLSVISIFVSFFIYKNQYARLIEKFNSVDEYLRRINCSMKRVSKKTDILSFGLVFGWCLLLMLEFLHSVILYKTKFGEWPGFNEFIIFNLHYYYKIAALLHMWIILYETKRRFNALKLILINLIR
jgi:hypothetical protein